VTAEAVPKHELAAALRRLLSCRQCGGEGRYLDRDQEGEPYEEACGCRYAARALLELYDAPEPEPTPPDEDIPF
jgi:hypothetical protein